MNTHFLNGSLVSEKDLIISPRDLGFARGYAVFDFLRTYGGRPFMLAEHIERLYNSAAKIGLKLPWQKAQLTGWVQDTLNANDPGEKFVKIMVSGGLSNTMLPSDEPTLIILVDPAVEYPPEMYTNGVDLLSVPYQRYQPEAKTNNYIEGVKQMQQAHVTGATEPLYYSDVQVYEGSNSNIFALINGKLMTPKSHILGGVTRNILLETLQLDVPVAAQDFTLDELRAADEAFLSASGKEITPVTSIDGRPIGDGTVGSVTREVMRQFRDYTLSGDWQS